VHQGLGGTLGVPTWVDDFWSGSRAAITGGITTIGNMTNPVPELPVRSAWPGREIQGP
jgi:dihydroorotase-like cyclic amidohydrolase